MRVRVRDSDKVKVRLELGSADDTIFEDHGSLIRRRDRDQSNGRELSPKFVSCTHRHAEDDEQRAVIGKDIVELVRVRPNFSDPHHEDETGEEHVDLRGSLGEEALDWLCSDRFVCDG